MIFKFSFFRMIDMGFCLSMYVDIESRVVYDLFVIFVYKGSMVNSGYYVVYIKDDCISEWW